MPQFDTLRALAFFGVAASHWLIEELPFAVLGGTLVQLFFVLSGFLITGILLDYRRIQEQTVGLTAASALRTFFVRRSLRIFPLFYAVIIVTAILNIGSMRQVWPWHASYLSNFLYVFKGSLENNPFSHFWTLAVEEQFYLVWPFLIFFIRLNAIKPFLLGLILFAPLFRIGIDITFPSLHRVNYLPFSCVDALAVGALLSFVSRNPEFFTTSILSIARRLLFTGIIGGTLVAVFISIKGGAHWMYSIGHTCLILVFGWLVFGASKGFRGPLGMILDRPELQFLGRISYGLYIFHHFFTAFDFHALFKQVGLPGHWASAVVVRLFLQLFFTVSLATLSWYLFEKPLNNLKRHFTLQKLDKPARTELNFRSSAPD